MIYPRLLTAAAVQGMINGMQALQASLGKDEIVNRPDLAVSFEEINALCGYAESQELEQRYLTKAELAKKYTD